MSDDLTAAGIVRSFGRTRVLRGINGTFQSGRVHTLVGPNGSGKTTLLRVLCGLLGFERGALGFGNLEISATEVIPWDARKGIAYMGHASFAYPQLSGKENLKLAAQLYEASAERVSEALARYQLEQAADRTVGSYSRGMTQRVALARVWIQDPHILLLDEPSTGLDASTHAILLEDLRAAAAENKVVLVVSHDPRDLEELAGNMHRMERGRLVRETEAT